jgi:hypothetical protein
MPDADPVPRLLRICLDLNVWVADFLATRRGRRGGSGPWLVDAVRAGHSPAGPLQLVVSLGMLERLGLVLVSVFGVEAAVAETALRAIAGIASLGPAGDHPFAVVGGGIYPIRDEEDRHVLETAVAGESDVLATANLADFAMDDIEWVGDGSRIRIYAPPGRPKLVIAHPDHVAAWLRSGRFPSTDIARGSIL